jgi:hypothetical protein
MADIPVHAGSSRVSTVHHKSSNPASKPVENKTQETSGAQGLHETKKVTDLHSNPANHSSSPQQSKHVTQSQSNAASSILHGEGHGASQTQGGHGGTTTTHGTGHGTPDAHGGTTAHGAGHGTPDAHGGGHGGGHEDPVAKGAQKSFEVVDYTNVAVHNAGHALAHGGHGGHGAHGTGHGTTEAHGTGHAEPHAPKPATPEVPTHAPEVKVETPKVKAPVTEPTITVREAHGEMAEMIENMKRNGAPIPEPTAPVKPTVQPTGEMAEYVEGIRAAQERDAAAIAELKQAKATTPPVKAAGAGEVTAEAVAHGVEGTSRAARVGGAMMKAATVAEGVLGPLGIYYGGKEVLHGVHQIHEAKDGMGVYDGATKVGLGVGTVVVGGAGTLSAGIAGTTAVLGATSGTATAISLGAQTVGKVAGGAVAIIDGANDLVHGLSKDENGNRDLGRAGRGTLKVAAGAMMIGGGPVGVAAGAALYAGVTIYENRKEIAAFAGHVADKVSEGAAYLKDKAVAGVNTAVSAVASVGSGIASAASSAWNAVTSWW